MYSMTVDEWNQEGLKRYGENTTQWVFKCPLCKMAITNNYYRQKPGLIPFIDCPYCGKVPKELMPIRITLPDKKTVFAHIMDFYEPLTKEPDAWTC